MKWTLGAYIAAAAIVLLSACGPGVSQAPRDASNVVQGPKTLTVAIKTEGTTIEGFTGEGGIRGGSTFASEVIHNHLTAIDPLEQPRPQLTTELPSIERGTWEMHADGRMSMTWRLHQGVRWHDGAPFTSEDLLFSLALHKDSELAHPYASVASAMESGSAPDSHTFIVHWARVDVKALQALALTPMPKHLLESLYHSDKTAFVNSPRFTTEFIGLGAYRLTSWERGSHMELARFDDYFLGRPPLDRIVVRFIGDPNTMLANLLAETIDILVPQSIDLESALELRRRWEGTGNRVRIGPRTGSNAYMEMMFRPEYARPVNGLPNLAVRQGLYHGIDRGAVIEAASAGIAPIADSWWAPNDPLRADVESAIVQYPYDPARAQQLLAQGGWARASDGTLVHAPSGERFNIDIWVNPQANDRIGTVVADNWKSLGVAATTNIIPASRTDDREYTAQHPGPLVATAYGDWSSDRLDSRQLATAANRWSGRNRAGYASPRLDALRDQLLQTVDPALRLPLLREQVQLVTNDVGLMALYWELWPLPTLKAVKGDIDPNRAGWNVFTWDREPG
jgi:peptide/nickel transport system substrate-binding protein